MIKLSDSLLGEFKEFIIGEYLGSGTSRDVYMFNPIPNTVIKIERTPSNGEAIFQNSVEWLIQKELEYLKKPSNKLARCIDISSCGRFLLQEYAEDITISEFEKVKKIKYPSFIADVKINNFGRTNDGRLVVRDYGSVYLLGKFKHELKKVKR